MSALIPPAVLSALCELHAESSTPAQRFHGQQVLEQLKAGSSPAALLATSTATFAAAADAAAAPPPPPLTPTILQHFSLHLLEHLVATHWTSLPPSDQFALQSYLLNLLLTLSSPFPTPSSPSPLPGPSLVLQKVVALTSNLILRTWPQHWPDLLPSLSLLPQRSPLLGSLLLCLLYQDLGEEVTTVGAVAEQRRKDVQAGLLLSLDSIFPFLLSSLASAEARLVDAALHTLRAMVEWLPARWLFETELIPRLLAMLGTGGGGHFIGCVELLTAVAGRKSQGHDVHVHARLLLVWTAVLQSVDALLAAPTFAHQHSFLTKTIATLSNLTRLHSALLTDSSPATPTSTPPSAASAAPLLPHFLSSLGALLSHPHPSISLEALELWVLVFRHLSSTLLPPSYRPSLIAELFKVCAVKVMKQPTESIPHTDDDLEESDYQQIFSHFRGTLTSLIHHLVELDAVVCFDLSLRRYADIVQGSGGLDHLNAAGYVTTSSQRFKEMESMAVMLDSMFRALPHSRFAAPPLADRAKELLSLLLSFQTADPLLQTRRLQALSLFTPIFLHHPQTLPVTVSALLSSVTFRSEREQSKPLSDLSEDTKACRRRAVHSLTHIARKCTALLLPSLEQSLAAVQGLVASGRLREEERTLLMEFLVTISAALPQREAQADFVRKMIGPQAERWSEHSMQEALRGGRGWLQVVGGGPDEVAAVRSVDGNGDVAVVRRRVKEAIASTQGRAMRAEILGSLNAFAAVFKGVIKGAGEPAADRAAVPLSLVSTSIEVVDLPHPSAPLLFGLLPSFFHLLSSIYGLRAPSSFPLLPPTLHGIVVTSVDHLQLLRASSPLLSHPDHLHSVIVHHFLEEATDALLLLLNIVTKAGSTLYAHLDLPLLQSCLLVHVPYMHVRQLRYLLERFVSSVMLECEPRWYSQGVMALLATLNEAVVGRLTVAWTEVKARQEGRGGAGGGGGGGSEAVEIWEESELRECTRAWVESYSRLVNAFDLRADRAEQRRSKDASNHVSLSDCPFFHFLFQQPQLAGSFLSALRFFLHAPDSQSQSKAARIGLRVVPMAVAHSELQPHLAALLDACLTFLSSIFYSPTAMTTLDNDMVALCTAIYQQVGKRSDAVRQVARGWTQGGEAEAALQDMDARMWREAMSEKRYRAIMKGWLTAAVLGRTGGKSSGVKVAALREQWDRDVGRKQRENDERGAAVEGGELQALFDHNSSHGEQRTA